MSKINKKKANKVRTNLILLIAKEQQVQKKKNKEKNLMMINGKTSLEIDKLYSTNSFEITMHQLINGGKNLCVSQNSSSKIKPRPSLSLKNQSTTFALLEVNNSTNLNSSKEIDSIKLQYKKKISENKLKLRSYNELTKKNINFNKEKEKKKELQKKSIRHLRKLASFYKNYLLCEKKKKFKKQKTVSIQFQIYEDNIHKNCISSKGIVKITKPSYFAKNAFQRNPEKKKTDNPKVKFVTDIIDFQNNDSDKETNFHSSVKQDKKELTDDDDEGIIFSSCNNDIEQNNVMV